MQTIYLHRNRKLTLRVANRATSITMQEMLFRLLSMKLTGRGDDTKTVSKWLEGRLTDHLGESTLSIGRNETILRLSAYCTQYALETIAQGEIKDAVLVEYYNTQ